MCLINFQLGNHQKYKLILAANRDEEYSRPTKEAHYWEDAPHILAGRDLRGMGTWLGVTKGGKIAALTNIRNKEELLGSYQKSRGELVSDFLNCSLSAPEYLENIKIQSNDYAGFNLLLGDVDGLYYMNNYDKESIRVENGIHGLSNHHLNTPWPKVECGKNNLEEITSNHFSIEDIFSLLRDDKKAAPSALPETGLSKEIESQLSSMFINTEHYGTRCSTVLTVSHENHITFSERTYLHGEKTGDVHYEFDVT